MQQRSDKPSRSASPRTRAVLSSCKSPHEPAEPPALLVEPRRPGVAVSGVRPCRDRQADGLCRCGRRHCRQGTTAGAAAAGGSHGPDGGGLGPGDQRLEGPTRSSAAAGVPGAHHPAVPRGCGRQDGADSAVQEPGNHGRSVAGGRSGQQGLRRGISRNLKNSRGTLRRSRKQGEYSQVCVLLSAFAGIYRELILKREVRGGFPIVFASVSPLLMLVAWSAMFSGVHAVAGLISEKRLSCSGAACESHSRAGCACS